MLRDRRTLIAVAVAVILAAAVAWAWFAPGDAEAGRRRDAAVQPGRVERLSNRTGPLPPAANVKLGVAGSAQSRTGRRDAQSVPFRAPRGREVRRPGDRDPALVLKPANRRSDRRRPVRLRRRRFR